ncbi:Spy/CpxP family protein refolding chaperone [Methylocapsa palsarum]|uniref:LTXXQ motif family protein n=1 Tax=Methylocapsa palsarum TaxID=1612308 RepID=A0A1I4A1N3_9HYPH|nr:Spy/CpxP family protein refolding chaperone [Methylocapsa palsarum]SFK50223.1 LTXXQ motif family protein [Methylocapsa palsarum]
MNTPKTKSKTKTMTKLTADLLLGLPFAAVVTFGAIAASAQAPAPAPTPAPAPPAQAMPGMDHGAHGMMGGAGMPGMDHAGMGHGGMDHTGMMGDMSQMRSMMHDMMGQMAASADERIAALKTELKITDAQAPLWKTFADALSAAAKSMDHAHHDMMPAAPAAAPVAVAPKPVVAHGDTSYPDLGIIKKTGDAPAPTAAPAAAKADDSTALPARLGHFEEALKEHLESLKAIKTSLDPLYASFSDEQKKIADGLMVGPMGVM